MANEEFQGRHDEESVGARDGIDELGGEAMSDVHRRAGSRPATPVEAEEFEQQYGLSSGGEIGRLSSVRNFVGALRYAGSALIQIANRADRNEVARNTSYF